MAKARVVRLGVTGGIGSGKSTVARILGELGAHTIDADAISRSTTQAGGAAIPAIAQIFGPDFIDQSGALDRAKMRELVFAQPDAKRQLEAIVHPLISESVAAQVREASAPCLVFDVPLLVESPHWRQQLDLIWVVDCARATQIHRVQQRNGWAREAVESVIDSQCPRELRLAAADAVFFNDGISLSELQDLVTNFASEFGL